MEEQKREQCKTVTYLYMGGELLRSAKFTEAKVKTRDNAKNPYQDGAKCKCARSSMEAGCRMQAMENLRGNTRV